MGSMLDLLGSYVIGGVVLVLMGAVIIGFQDTNRETMVQEISQISLAEMSQTMERELTNMGYRVYGTNKVISLTNQGITFLSDFDNDGAVDTISYVMRNTKTGPAISRTISRPGKTSLEWTTRGSMILFTGYDEKGVVTFDPSKIRAVEASMLTSNILYEKLQDSDLLGASTASRSNTTVTTQTTLSINQSSLLQTAVDCEAGAYWHKMIYPRNLAVDLEAPVPEDAGSESASSGTGTGNGGTTTDPGTGGTGTTDPGAGGGTTTTDPGTGGSTVVTDPGSGSTVITPPANKNDPCPCGSGLKYKNCHGA